ncbi:MAG TPA: hypothetical protein VG672_30435 [Bryobacteraceae bacterium]|jgi:hypothetical protein|nr:hypothetical protein [Bryobacteraceae bacterium]
MRRFLIWSASSLLLIAATYIVANHITYRTMAHAAVIAHPFTVEQWTYSYSSTPPQVTEKRTFARRSDGSEVTVSVHPATPKLGVIRKLEWGDGATITLADAIMAKTSSWLKREDLAAKKQRLQNPPPKCAFPGEQVIGQETLSGVSVWRVVRELPDRRLSEWRASEYACQAIRALGETRSPDGSYKRQFEATLVYLQPGEPDPLLFASGNQYKEMPPSEAKRNALRNMGLDEVKCPTCFDSNWDSEMDAAYRKRQERP